MFESTPLPDLLIVSPPRFGDERGFFTESWSRRAYEAQGLEFDWVQDNHSLSRAAGVLRGLHYQAPPMAQTKLVRCTAGRIWDVAVDVRPGSEQYGRSFGVELSAENGKQLLVPRGFLHGFLTLVPDCEVQYKVDAPYDRDCDGAVAWNDPDLAVAWPLDQVVGELPGGQPVLSGKDETAPALKDWRNPFGDGQG